MKMKVIEYKVLYSDKADPRLIRVHARDINAGFSKALRLARKGGREIVRIEFLQVCS